MADANPPCDRWLGTWALGGKGISGRIKAPLALLHAAYQSGIRQVDTAFFYGQGQAHDTLAKAIQQTHRSHWHICEKVGLRWNGPNHVIHAGTATEIIADCQRALRRLNTEYIDTLTLHWPDPKCAIDDSVTGLETCVQRGYARQWGVSNLSHEHHHCLHKQPHTLYQLEHNCILNNSAQLEQVHQNYRTYNLVYSPLASGWLANPDYLSQPVSKSNRRARHPIYTQPDYRSACAHFHQTTENPIRDALQWVCNQPAIHGIILGPRSPEHLHQLLRYTAASTTL